LKLGIVTPVVTRLPGAHARWEATAGIDEIARVVVEAERLGYDFCTCSEHVAVPVEAAAARGGTYWDPLPTFGYLAARTERIRFATFVLVLGYHHPLAIAKRYGTLDRVSNGRVVLGVGVGSLEEEFVLLGAEFEHRGAMGDEAIRAVRASLAEPEPHFDGDYFAFAGFVVDPAAVQDHLPIWVGGRTGRSLRRAVELADGWAPFGLRTAELAEMLQRAHDTEAWAARPEPLDVIVQNDRPLDPIEEPDRAAEQLARYGDIGATAVAARFVHHSLDHYLEQLAALAES
jgi:probable F420-dependent oxidoreductase